MNMSIFQVCTHIFIHHKMNYTTNIIEVITLDSYRNNRCGGCRNANTRCVSTSAPYRSRCVMPDENCNPPHKPDCNMRPYDRSSFDKTDCDCGDSNKHMREMRIGIGYIPMQTWGEMYDPCTALCQGTAFPELNLIFCGVRG